MNDVPELTPEEIQARVLHRDGLMLVIDKPAGLPVHRGPKGGPNLETSFDALRYGLPRPPVLAHRLDRDTSGCLVLGRHRKATASLGLLFKHGRISKTYWAVVDGGPVEDEGTIDLPLGRLNVERGWWQKVDPDGQPSMTKWRVMGRSSSLKTEPPTPDPLSASSRRGPPHEECVGGGERAAFSPLPPLGGEGSGVGGDKAVALTDPISSQLTWLAMEPITGRTHQLRVHCAAMGWPIIGDSIYGHDAVARRARNESFVLKPGDPTLHLHAREIVIPISRNKEPVRVQAPAPEHLHARLRACGWDGV